MLKSAATLLNQLGNILEHRGSHAMGAFSYWLASFLNSRWSSPWYNMGLQAKYLGRWEQSAEYNKRAADLDPSDEATWWNLAIAATALRDWNEAAKAWKQIGIEPELTPNGLVTPPTTACVRLNPNEEGEVVWGTRIDPARIQIRNVPLPNSRRRYRDIILNDGAQEGVRTSGGEEYPVFNELGVWQASSYCTFQSSLEYSDEDAEDKLMEICAESEIGAEDWGSLRILCAACSKGSPGEHGCDATAVKDGAHNFGFGSVHRETLVAALTAWAASESGRSFSDPHLVLLAN